MAVTRIESGNNPLVKTLVALKNKKTRDATCQFVLEGLRFVSDIPKNWQIECYVFSQTGQQKVNLDDFANRAAVYILADHVFAKVSDTQNPQGILAVCVQQKCQLSACITANSSFLIFGENIADPGNLGTVIRTAAAASCDGIVLSNGCVEVYNPKVLRAAAGAIFSVPVVQGVTVRSGLNTLRENGFNLLAAHLQGTVYPYGFDLKQKCCILIGNEGNGLSQEASTLAHVLVKIPMAENVESLNASVASGILMYEVVRQRL